MPVNLEALNQELATLHPQEIVARTLAQGCRPIVTSNFGPHEAAILHLCTQVKADIPVIWIDSGYATAATYRFAHQLIERLNLNIKIYHPCYSRGYIDAACGGIPDVDTPEHERFTRWVKLDPFNRAMHDINPDLWLTAIRKDQTEFRQGLDIVTKTAFGALRVAPLFHWSELDLEEYLVEHDLPIEEDYYDPTKVQGHRECGLHPSSSRKA